MISDWIKENVRYYLFKLDILKKLKPGRILDFGCGQGQVSAWLITKGFDTYACDLKIYEEWNLGLFKGVKFCLYKNKLNFKENYFDYILCFDVLEHIDDPRETLRELYRILKKNGLMIITTPIIYPDNIEYLKKVKKVFNHKRIGWNKDELKEMLEKIGFKVKIRELEYCIFMVRK